MTAKLLKTIFALKFSSKWNYRFHRQQRNGHLEALKMIENLTNRQFGLKKYMNWSKFHSTKLTKANLHSLCRLDSSSSFCNSFLSSLEHWEFASWLVFSAISSLQTSQKVCSGDESVSTQLEFCYQPASKPREQLNGFQFWFASFMTFSFLIGRRQLAKIYFSPLNCPFRSAKYAAMPDEVIIMIRNLFA